MPGPTSYASGYELPALLDGIVRHYFTWDPPFLACIHELYAPLLRGLPLIDKFIAVTAAPQSFLLSFMPEPEPASGRLAAARPRQHQGQQVSLWQRSLSWIPGTRQHKSHGKLHSQSRVPVVYSVSGFVLLVVLLIQFFGPRDLPPRPLAPTHSPEPVRNLLDPFGDSVYRQEAYFDHLEPGTQCRPKSPFSSELPITHAITNMALEAEAKRVAAEFEFSSEDVNKGVIVFIREMEEGLEKQGTYLSQIPTYVTSVPNGTEKV